jgi:hypothetical protein
VYFQTLDDKKECIGVYHGEELHFDRYPQNLSKTWKASSSVRNKKIDYAWVFSKGTDLENACPEDLRPEYKRLSRKFKAYIKAFNIANVPMDELCFFDLVPQTFLLDWCELKNQISHHVFENYEKPAAYDHLVKVHELLVDISNQKLNLNLDGCRGLFVSSRLRPMATKMLETNPYIHYNLYGTVTGRLTTLNTGFSLLTIDKKLRKIIKPNNDWFVSFDYNGADVRTFLALVGEEQPQEDIHEWNAGNLFGGAMSGKRIMDREEAKIAFFSWLYNPKDKTYDNGLYNREKALSKYLFGTAIINPFGRKIEVVDGRALNYLIQSTTNDLTMERAVAISKLLEGRTSYVSHLVHDEVVVDFSDEDRDLLPVLKKTFSQTKVGNFLTNVTAGKDYFDMSELKI